MYSDYESFIIILKKLGGEWNGFTTYGEDCGGCGV
jgi:hypothetical protein